LRIGTENSQEIKNTFSPFFDISGHLIQAKILEFKNVLQQNSIQYNITIYDDAQILINTILRNQERQSTLAKVNIYSDSEYSTSVKLRDYQLESIFFILKNARTIINYEYGLGMGIMALHSILLAKKYFQVKKILIISNSYQYWHSKFEYFTQEKILHIIDDDSSRKKLININSEFIKIINPEDAANDLKQINCHGFDFILIDDSSIFNNLNSTLSKQLKLLNSEFLVILSTSKLLSNIESFYSQIQAVDMYLPGSFFNFINRYSIKNAQGKIVSLKNIDELRIHVNDVFTKVDVTNTNTKANQYNQIFKSIHVGLLPEHKNIYFEYLNKLQTFFYNLNRSEQLAEVAKTIQLVTSLYLFNKTNSESKLITLIKLLEEIDIEEKNILIVCEWNEYTDFIRTYLLHTNLELKEEKISIIASYQVQNTDLSNYRYIICTDIFSKLKIIETNSCIGCLIYTLIAENTFETKLNRTITYNEFDLVEKLKNYLINHENEKVHLNFNKSKTFKQLSFIGDDDIDENSNNGNTEVEDFISFFMTLNNKLLNQEFRNSLRNNEHLPEKLKLLIELYQE
jgi:hypothetical protein